MAHIIRILRHDMIIPEAPLCTAWLDCPLKGGEKGPCVSKLCFFWMTLLIFLKFGFRVGRELCSYRVNGITNDRDMGC